MDKQEFTLGDGKLAAKVVCEPSDKRITITFDISDRSSGKPVIDMERYYSAVKHQQTLQSVMQQVSTESKVGMGEMTQDGTITMQASFNHTPDSERAVQILREITLQSPKSFSPASPSAEDSNPTLLEKLGSEYSTHPQDMPDVAPETRPENSRTQAFLQKFIRAENEAEVRGSLKLWDLEGQASGLSVSIFPVDRSVLTGNMKHDGTGMVAIHITPGIDTKDARSATYRNTHELEKRLISRGLLLHSSEVFIGSEADGHHDTGIILINPEPSQLVALERANEVLQDIQQHDHQVISLKLGTRNRGEDHHHRSKIATIALRHPDPMEIMLESHLRAAADNGLIKLNGSQEAIADWVRHVVSDIRDMQSPARKGTAERQ